MERVNIQKFQRKAWTYIHSIPLVITRKFEDAYIVLPYSKKLENMLGEGEIKKVIEENTQKINQRYDRTEVSSA